MEASGLTCMPRLPPSNKRDAYPVTRIRRIDGGRGRNVLCLCADQQEVLKGAHHSLDIIRPLADFDPTVWGEFFDHPVAAAGQNDHAWMQQRVEKLTEEVRMMFAKDMCDFHQLVEEMELVDALQRLGLAHHFQTEICEALVRIHSTRVGDDADLHAVSLRFRLLRQEGYNASSVEFNKFKNVDGHFRKSLSSDVKGLLSLYEAAHLGTHTDALLLDEAISFCRNQLEPMLGLLQPPVAAEVARACETPLIRRIRRLETRQYISFYEATEGRNDLILELAKLDFNLLQSLHQEEIRQLTRWWKGLGLTKSLSFARDRLVECYLWVIGVHKEARFSRARMMLSKMLILLTFLDDLYDSYGTLEELQLLTDVIQRWDTGAIEGLPEYLKIYMVALTKTVKEFGDELLHVQNSYRLQRLKEEIKMIAEGFLKEAEWCSEGHVPALKDRLNVSLILSGVSTLTGASFVGMGDNAPEEAFNWLRSNPKMVEASAIVSRLMNDMVPDESEQRRPHVASVVQCYMKEYGVSQDMACQKLGEMVDGAWKVMNEERIQDTRIPLQLLDVPFNIARVTHFYYNHGDAFTRSAGVAKDVISSLFVKCFPI